jgi:PTH1 family peptidyl-tRNA hydrolase
MKLLVGLGNPGEEYSRTRHNIGFLAINEIAKKFHVEKFNSKYNSLCTEIKIGKNRILLVMPQTYMNRSGTAVQGFCTFFRIKPENVIVIHDDIDLDTGRIKVKLGGGHGGHNGLKSMDQCIGQNYLRVRLGIGKPIGPIDVADYVLSRFHRDEEHYVSEMIQFVANNIDDLLIENVSADNISRFLAKYSKKP